LFVFTFIVDYLFKYSKRSNLAFYVLVFRVLELGFVPNMH